MSTETTNNTVTFNLANRVAKPSLKRSVGKGIADSFGLISDTVSFARTAIRAEHLDYKLDILTDIADNYGITVDEARVMLAGEI